MSTNPMQGDARRLPLWRSWLEENAASLKPGSVIEAKALAEYLGVEVDSWTFAKSMIRIARTMEEATPSLMLNGWDGRSISGKKAWLIVPGDKVLKEVARRITSANRELRRHIATGARVDRSIMPAEDAARLDDILEREAWILQAGNRARRLKQERFDAWKNSPVTPQKRIKSKDNPS